MRTKPAFIQAGCWPARMTPEIAAGYVGERSAEVFLRLVGKEYPHPVIDTGSGKGRRLLWLKTDLDRAIGVSDPPNAGTEHLDKARHGGMTELKEKSLTEGQGKALSTHRTKAYRVYAKETDKRVLNATLKRFGHSENEKNTPELMVENNQNRFKK